MTQPSGFQYKDYPNYVCKLNKSLHGFKQVPRVCLEKLVDVLVGLDFASSVTESSLFGHKLGSKWTIIWCVLMILSLLPLMHLAVIFLLLILGHSFLLKILVFFTFSWDWR